MTRSSRWGAQHGATIVEALVAFLVLAFGLLAIAGFQVTLSRNSDLSKQRTEAMRLAQERLEELRTFQSLTGYSALAAQAEATVNGYSTNTAYTVESTITTLPSTTPPVIPPDPTLDYADHKLAAVIVRWTDRAGTAQRVTLSSTIAGIDPRQSGRLTLAQTYGGIRRPKDRAVSIPYPAKAISTTESTYKPVESGTRAFVFNNLTGEIRQSCTVSSASTTDSLTAADLTTTNCTAVVGYLLSGYIRYSYASGTPNAEIPNDPPLPSVSMQMNLTTLAQAYPQLPECFTERRKTVKYSTGPSSTRLIDVPYTTPNPTTLTPYTDTTVSPPISVTSWTDVESYTTYSCVIYPADHDSNTTTPRIWTGYPTVTGITIGGLGFEVCRYSFDYDNSNPSDATNSADTNLEHPAVYTAVNSSLSDQNYLVIDHSRTCPSDNNEIDPLASPPRYVNYNTITYQN